MNGEKLISAFRKVRSRFVSGGSLPGGSDDAEDALQDAFCRLWTRKEKISDSSNAEGLIVTVVRNIRIDGARKRISHPENSLEEVGQLQESPPDDESLHDLYYRIDLMASRSLSERDKEILYRREKDGWDFEDLAEYYGLSESNVRMIVSRARKTLRSLYKSKYENNG